MLIAELNKTRRIGCEFEMTCPLIGRGNGSDVQEVIAEVLGRNGITAIFRPYDNSPLSQGVDVGVEYDSSIRGEQRFQGIQWFSIEIKTRVLEGINDWETVIPKTLEICKYMGARTNKSCGFHIHLDLLEVHNKPTIIKSLFNLFCRYEPVIYGLVAPSRTDNNYAQAIAPEQATMLRGCRSVRSFRRGLMSWHEKSGLNLTLLFLDRLLAEHPRIEIRYHHGTLDPVKARH